MLKVPKIFFKKKTVLQFWRHHKTWVNIETLTFNLSLNLLNELENSDKMQAALILDSIYHMALFKITLKSHFLRENVKI